MLSTCTASEKHIFRRNSFARIRVFSSPFSFFIRAREKFLQSDYFHAHEIDKYLSPLGEYTIYIYSSIVCQCNNIIKSVRRSKKQADPIPARSTVCSRVCFAATFSTDPSYIACIYIYTLPFRFPTRQEMNRPQLNYDGSTMDLHNP